MGEEEHDSKEGDVSGMVMGGVRRGDGADADVPPASGLN